MDNNSIQEAFQKILAELAEELTDNKAELTSKSFVFLDSKTINLLLLYILMNKDLQLKRLTNRNFPAVNQQAIMEEIDRMMDENKQAFEEMIRGLRKNS